MPGHLVILLGAETALVIDADLVHSSGMLALIGEDVVMFRPEVGALPRPQTGVCFHRPSAYTACRLFSTGLGDILGMAAAFLLTVEGLAAPPLTSAYMGTFGVGVCLSRCGRSQSPSPRAKTSTKW